MSGGKEASFMLYTLLVAFNAISHFGFYNSPVL